MCYLLHCWQGNGLDGIIVVHAKKTPKNPLFLSTVSVAVFEIRATLFVSKYQMYFSSSSKNYLTKSY